ncbi:MAG: hypothetical protein ABOK23_08565 [Candidatus Methanoperedens sp.]|nr:hypothetical protein [Candidatus Methanoperedens sp.]
MFDEHGSARKTYGSRGGRLFRNADDPNETVIIFKWDSLDKARKFVKSEDTKKAMQRAGVADKPDVYFLDEVEKVPV